LNDMTRLFLAECQSSPLVRQMAQDVWGDHEDKPGGSVYACVDMEYALREWFELVRAQTERRVDDILLLSIWSYAFMSVNWVLVAELILQNVAGYSTNRIRNNDRHRGLHELRGRDASIEEIGHT
jgi:hypothetical protein